MNTREVISECRCYKINVQNKTEILTQDKEEICENARRCLAEAQALMARLDRLDFELENATEIPHPAAFASTLNSNNVQSMPSTR